MEKYLLILLLPAIWFIIRLIRNRKARVGRLVFSEVSNSNFKIKGVFYTMELKEGYQLTFLLEPKTSRGHAAAIQAGSVRVSSSDPAVVSVEQDPTNELAIKVKGLDGSANESVVIEVRADGDPSEGVRELVGTKSIVCTQGDAAIFDLTQVGDPEPFEGSEQPGPAEPAPAENSGGASGEGSGGATSEGSGEPAGGDPAEVQPGDPGTATGPPIEQPNPNETAPGAGDPNADPDANAAAGSGAEPIAGADTAGQPNPVEGTEADSTKPPA